MNRISVIMPVKNAEATIERAVRSIQAQTYHNWELIAVDDGSADSTGNRLAKLANNDPRIRIEQLPPSGIVNALNRGIQSANGQIIARMDADDVSHPDRLRLQISFLNENKKIGLVSSRVNYRGDSQVQKGYAAYVSWTNSLLDWESIRKNRFVESPIAHPSVMFRRSLLTPNTGPYRQGPFPEDYELWLRWMAEGVVMAKLKTPLLDWYDLPERLSRNDPRYSPVGFYETKACYLAKWLKEQDRRNRPMWIWGAGRITRKRASLLENHGIRFSGFVDIDTRKAGGRVQTLPVVLPDDLDLSVNPYIISYVGNRGAREEIRRYLIKRGLSEEADFILAA